MSLARSSARASSAASRALTRPALTGPMLSIHDPFLGGFGGLDFLFARAAFRPLSLGSTMNRSMIPRSPFLGSFFTDNMMGSVMMNPEFVEKCNPTTETWTSPDGKFRGTTTRGSYADLTGRGSFMQSFSSWSNMAPVKQDTASTAKGTSASNGSNEFAPATDAEVDIIPGHGVRRKIEEIGDADEVETPK